MMTSHLMTVRLKHRVTIMTLELPVVRSGFLLRGGCCFSAGWALDRTINIKGLLQLEPSQKSGPLLNP
jgi:hypothetical protein